MFATALANSRVTGGALQGISEEVRLRFAKVLDAALERIDSAEPAGPASTVGAVTDDAVMHALEILTRFRVPRDSRVSRARMLLGNWERSTVRVLSRLARPGMTVIDVGAHVGYFARFLGRCVRPTGRVFAFEPHPDNYRLLLQNTRRLPVVEAIEAAVSDDDGRRALFESHSSDTHSLYPLGMGLEKRCVEVATTSLDSFVALRGIEQVDLIKVDAEGSELEVLQGTRGLIRSSPKVAIVVEYFPKLWEGRGDENALIDVLRDLRLQIYSIEEPGGRLTPIDHRWRWEGTQLAYGDHVNLLATRWGASALG